MAYVNVKEWRAEQVAEWLKGLDDVIYPYAHFFVSNNVTGQALLSLTVDDLYKLQVEKLGHQEIILEALELLKNLHFNLDTENLQYVCLRLSCRATSVVNEIRMYGPSPDEPNQTVPTSTMSAVADVMDSLWVLLSWLDRPPFNDQPVYKKAKQVFKGTFIKLCVTAQRDRFVENHSREILLHCERLAAEAEHLIRDVCDSLILQPAYLEVATAKRRPDEESFGMVFETAAGGAHLIREVLPQAGVLRQAEIEHGDEVIQVNYQTVVGWQGKKMVQLMEENPSKVILTLKKRPRHYGQIYLKPFRIPARENEVKFNNLPAPRVELLVAPSIAFPKKPRPHLAKPVVPPVPPPTNSEATSKKPALPSLNVVSDVHKKSNASSSDDEHNNEDEEHGEEHDDDVVADEDSDDGYDLASDEILDASVGNGDDDSSSDSDDSISCELSEVNKRSSSPAHSIRSLLSRPRSAPLRRATISGTSPTQYTPYINISEIWSHMRASKEMSQQQQHRQSQPSSNTSTLRSKDSGLSTMSSAKQETARPQTLAEFDVEKKDINRGPYMNVPTKVGTLDSGFSQCKDSSGPHEAIPSRNPLPQPRSQHPPDETMTTTSPPSALLKPSPSRHFAQTTAKRRPIPQPRSIAKTSCHDHSISSVSSGRGSSLSGCSQDYSSSKESSLKSSLRSLLPDSVTKPPAMPVPGANFKSYKRVTTESPKPPPPPPQPQPQPPQQQLQQPQINPDYVNTAAPLLPARRPTTNSPPPRPPSPPPRQQSPPLWPQSPPLPKRSSGSLTPSLGDPLPLPTTAPPPRPAMPPPAAQSTSGVVMRQKSPHKNRRLSGSDFSLSNRHGFIGSPDVDVRTPTSSSSRRSRMREHGGGGQDQQGAAQQDVYMEGSPEKHWIDSLRQEEGLKSVHSYLPLPPSNDRSRFDPHQLQVAFDMELGPQKPLRAPRTDSNIEQHDYTHLSDTSSSDQSSELPPLFSPSSYSFQDFSRRKLLKKQSK